jgi:hypothetical protein
MKTILSETKRLNDTKFFWRKFDTASVDATTLSITAPSITTPSITTPIITARSITTLIITTLSITALSITALSIINLQAALGMCDTEHYTQQNGLIALLSITAASICDTSKFSVVMLSGAFFIVMLNVFWMCAVFLIIMPIVVMLCVVTQCHSCCVRINDTQHNDIQHYDPDHNGLICDTA